MKLLINIKEILYIVLFIDFGISIIWHLGGLSWLCSLLADFGELVNMFR